MNIITTDVSTLTSDSIYKVLNIFGFVNTDTTEYNGITSYVYQNPTSDVVYVTYYTNGSIAVSRYVGDSLYVYDGDRAPLGVLPPTYGLLPCRIRTNTPL